HEEPTSIHQPRWQAFSERTPLALDEGPLLLKPSAHSRRHRVFGVAVFEFFQPPDRSASLTFAKAFFTSFRAPLAAPVTLLAGEDGYWHRLSEFGFDNLQVAAKASFRVFRRYFCRPGS